LIVLKPPPEPLGRNKPTELITPGARAQLGLPPEEPAKPGPVAEYTLQIVDVAQRRVLRTHDVTDSVSGSLLALDWSPDGKRLLFRYWNQTVVIDAETGRAELILKRWGTEWSPTGEAVYSQSDIDDRGLFRRSDLVLTPVNGGNPQVIVGKEELDRSGATLEFLSLSAKGDRVALGFSDSAALGILRIYSVAADGRFILAKPISEAKTPFVPLRVQWAPDDQQLAVLALTIKKIPQRGQPTNVDVADVRIQVLDLATGRWRAVGLVASDIRTIEFLGIVNIMSW
jgi:hypothetical protein